MLDADHVFVVPANAIVHRQAIQRLPLILKEQRIDVVVQHDDRVADVLRELGRIRGPDVRIELLRRGEREGAIEIVVKQRIQLDEARIDTDLERVVAKTVGHDPAECVGELPAILGAPLRHVACLAQSQARAIDRRALRAVRRDVPVEVAPCELHAKLVQSARADDQVVVNSQVLVFPHTILSAFTGGGAANAGTGQLITVDPIAHG
jgi:hypothetical protein